MGRGFSQHLPLLQMFLIVDKVVPLLLKCARVNACVLSGVWGIVHANGPRQVGWREGIERLAVGSGSIG